MNNELSQYSKKMSALILGEFPGWKDYAGIDEYNGEVYFNVVVPSPSNNAEGPLRVYTYQDEITVSFDAYHAHFYEFKEESSEIEDDDAFSFITKIINGLHAVVSYWHDDQWNGSTLLPEEEFPINNEEYPYANKIKIRSWYGNLDREIECKSRK